MYHFTIRDVENLSGIKAHTLRMWEQRYGLCVCKRRASQHRYYDGEDLKYILRIAYLYHNGYRISRIAALSSEEINQLALKKFNNDEYEVLVNQLVESCLEYDEQKFEKSLRSLLGNMGLEKGIEKVVFPFLDKIGLLWMTGHVLPAQEHISSHLIQKFIISATNALPAVTENKGYRFLLFTPQGEMHEMPLLFVQYILKRRGFKSIMLGKNITADMIEYCCTHHTVTHLYFHLITNFTNGSADEYVNKLSAAFPNLQIMASGGALKGLDKLNTPPNVTILHSLQEVIAFPVNA
ncbi:MAG: MerR family transcriptional regulator [Chitinophagaceae bacterium]